MKVCDFILSVLVFKGIRALKDMYGETLFDIKAYTMIVEHTPFYFLLYVAQ